MKKTVSETKLYVALIVGGSIVIPHLRYAFQVMEEILVV